MARSVEKAVFPSKIPATQGREGDGERERVLAQEPHGASDIPDLRTPLGPCPSVQGVSLPRMPAMLYLDRGVGQGEAGGSWNTPNSKALPVPKATPIPKTPHSPNFSVPKTLPDALAVQPVLLPAFLWEFPNHSQFPKPPQLPVWLLQLPVPSSRCGSCSSQTFPTSQNSCSWSLVSQSWFLQLPKHFQFPKQPLALGVAPPPHPTSDPPDPLKIPLWIHPSSLSHLRPLGCSLRSPDPLKISVWIHPYLTPGTPAWIPRDRSCSGSAWTWTGGARRRGIPSGSHG